MENILILIILVFAFWLATRLLKSFSQGTALKTVPASEAKIEGTFTLILYGGNLSDDFETIAILDREDDRYTFEPFAPEFKYRIKRNVPAKEAITEAESFIRSHSSFHRSAVSGIVDEHGVTLGYEFKPLYLPISVGAEDVLDLNYRMKGDKVIIYVSLKSFPGKKQSA